MPDISFPAGTTVADGDTSDADQVAEKLYSPDETTPASLEVVDGWLDGDNLASGAEIAHEHVQRGAIARPEVSGATANLDFFYAELFNEITLNEQGISGGALDEPFNDFVYIPGACRNFYLPHDVSLVLFLWQLAWGTDGDDGGSRQDAPVWFFLDGERAADDHRRCVPAAGGVLSTAAGQYVGNRLWSGHHLEADMTAGWHSAGLKIATRAPQARVRVRHLSVVPIL